MAAIPQRHSGLPVILTVEETARVLKKQPARVRKWITEGSLRASRLEWTWAIRLEDLEAFLDAHVSTAKRPRARKG